MCFFLLFFCRIQSELTWSEYVQEQAYYILVNRPNNPIGNRDMNVLDPPKFHIIRMILGFF